MGAESAAYQPGCQVHESVSPMHLTRALVALAFLAAGLPTRGKGEVKT